MQNNRLTHIAYVSRILLGFLFIYHGLVPKILWLSDIEVHLVSLSGTTLPASIISPIAGVAEILLGLTIIFSRSRIPIYIAASALIGLLLYVLVMSPKLLVEAFNPVTTNILGLGLCYLVLSASKQDLEELSSSAAE